MTIAPKTGTIIAATALTLTISFLLTLFVSAMTFNPLTELTSAENQTKVEIIEM